VTLVQGKEAGDLQKQPHTHHEPFIKQASLHERDMEKEKERKQQQQNPSLLQPLPKTPLQVYQPPKRSQYRF